MVRRLLRTKKRKNPKPEPRFPFRNFHFGLASDPLHCRHIQEDSKEDTQDSGAESDPEPEPEQPKEAKKEKKKSDSKNKEKSPKDVFEGEAKPRKKK